MKKYLGLLSICLSCTSFADDKTTYTYTYQSETGGKTTKTHWTVTTDGDEMEAIGKSEDDNTTINYGSNLPLNFKEVKTDSTFEVKYHSGSIIATLVKDGQSQEKKYSLNTNWIQEFNFPLREFILGSQNSYRFCIVSPKDLSLNQMQAQKKGLQNIEVMGKSTEALFVDISLTGFKSMFWSAKTWFDPKTGDLLLYKANEGPGTPLTTQTLIERSQPKKS